MKLSTTKVKAVLPGFSVAGVGRGLALSALLVTGASYAGIVGSKHDLGSGGLAQTTTSATTEVCVFCHTPHGSDTAAAVPLWNKKLTSGTYIRYSSLGTATLDGAETAIGSVTLACLSCHDGTQAMDVMINLPGSGGYNAGGTELEAGGIEVMTGVPIPMLGVDLTNDHPVSIQYAGGGCTTGGADCVSSSFGDKDFVTAQGDTINSNSVWWVDTSGGTANSRDKTDMFLYTRTATPQPFVECGSCHDPHEDTAQPVSFMRISNENSAVCTACHNK